MISLIKGDITKDVKVDAIVNAANGSLVDGGGVCGAIHKAAGPELEKYNQQFNDGSCQTGHAKLSPSFDLFHSTGAGYIIHTVGPDVRMPKWQDIFAMPSELAAEALRDCYINSFTLAVRYGLKSIAFPSISTGIFTYPILEAAEIAIEEATNLILQYDIRVAFCLFSDSDLEVYRKLLNRA